MSKWDKEYCKLLREIVTNGTRTQNRTGVDSIKIPSWSFTLDLAEEFPILLSLIHI